VAQKQEYSVEENENGLESSIFINIFIKRTFYELYQDLSKLGIHIKTFKKIFYLYMPTKNS